MALDIVRIERLVTRKAEDHGGKAKSLARLARAGFPVAPAYVVPGVVGERFLEQALSAGQRLPALLADPNVVDARLEEIRARILAAPMPEAIAAALARVRTDLAGADGALVLRSSPTIDDVDEATSIGLHTSALNIVSDEGLFDAARAAWAAPFTPRVLEHLRAAGRGSGLRIGLVISALVPAQVAGVALTVDALTGDEGQIVIDALYGLGVPLTRGQVAPDTTRLDKTTLTIRDRVIGAKARRLVAVPEGGTRYEDVPPDEASAPALEGERLLEVARIARRVEKHFGEPYEVGFVCVGDEVKLIAATPARSHARRRRREDHGGRPRVWSAITVGEALPGVVTPLTWSLVGAFQDIGLRRALGALGCRVPRGVEILGSFRGRAYLDVTTLAEVLSQIPGLDVGEVLAAAAPDVEHALTGVSRRGQLDYVVRSPITAARLVFDATTAPRRIEEHDIMLAEEQRRLLAVDMRVLTSASLSRSLRDVERLLDDVGSVLLSVHGGLVLASTALAMILQMSAADRATAIALERDLLTGLDALASVEPLLALTRVAEIALRDEAALVALSGEATTLTDLPPGATREALTAVLARHGHRGVRETELAEPRFTEDPRPLVAVLRGLVHGERADAVLRAHDRATIDARLRVDAALSGFALPTRVTISALQTEVKRLLRRRERLRADLATVVGLGRKVALEISRRLEVREPDAGVAAAFFLTTEELHAMLDGAAKHVTLRVQQRRTAYDRDRDVPSPAWVFTGRPDDEPPTPAPVLTGVGASPGSAIGRVRLLREGEPPIAVADDEIVVARSIDLGNAFALLGARGVVAEGGGMLSDAGVAARELGLPAIVGVSSATRAFVDGERIRIDADAGTVERA